MFHNDEEGSRSTKRSCLLVAISSDDYIFFHFDKFLNRIEYDCIRKLEMPVASRKPTARWVLNQAHPMQRRCLKYDSRMHTLAGDWKAAEKPVASRRRRFRRLRQSCGWNLVPQRGIYCPKQLSLEETPCTRSQFFSWQGQSKRIQKRPGITISTYRRTHRTLWKSSCPWSGISLEKHLTIHLVNLNVNLTTWRKFMNTTLRVAVHFGQDDDTNLRFVENYLWEAFQRNR